MKRYYLSDLIGDGSVDNPYRAAVSDHGMNHIAVFPPQNMETGAYEGTSCLVLVSAAQHRALLGDRRIDALPEFPLDGKLNAMQSNALAGLEQAITRRGFAAAWANSDGYRQVIRSVGQQLDPVFDEANFDVL